LSRPHPPATTRDAILGLLSTADMTARDISDALGRGIKAVESSIRNMRVLSPGQFLHVVGYRRQVNRPGREAPVYRAGPGEDAPRLDLRTPEVRREYKLRARSKARTRPPAPSKPRPARRRPAMPFDQLVRHLSAN